VELLKATPVTLDELPTLAEWARTDLEDIVASVLCCNLKYVLQVLFGMLRRPPAARGRKCKAAQSLNASRKRGRPKTRRAPALVADLEMDSEVEPEVEPESEHEEEGDDG
jgi:hypothetical protein